ncbi:MAG: linear amide C-N hydrolase [bacterium]|nr:linear amide C-N hydrolase [bacterium]
MNNLKPILFTAIVLFFLLPGQSPACSTFCFRDGGEWVFGRNYDWETGHCLIIVNKRGIVKTALRDRNPAKWESKYGSVTFNQYGREFPLGGINEAGLVVECMWLSAAKYGQPDSRATVEELQWIQYQLDNCATVQEVLATDKTIKIDVGDTYPLHYLVCDRKGNAAAIEFLNGKMVSHSTTTGNLPVSALTNSTYRSSLRLLDRVKGDEGSSSMERADYSHKRFVWAGQGIRQWKPGSSESPVKFSFKLLNKVAVPRTMFRVVYDLKHSRIYYRTKSVPSIRYVDLKPLDFSCDTPVKILDTALPGSGDMTSSFVPYTFKTNFEILKKAYKETDMLSNAPLSRIRKRAEYPETLHCKH